MAQGTDQKFNLLVGRELQREYGQAPQVVMTVPILEGTDGVQKMSKSLSNAIGLTEAPQEMFGKVMSISDEMMYRYWELLTDLSLKTIDDMREMAKSHLINPKETKAELAEKIVSDFHSPKAAKEARKEFVQIFQQGQAPPEIEEELHRFSQNMEHPSEPNVITILNVSSSDRSWTKDGKFKLNRLLHDERLASSISEADRKLKAGAVYINGDRCREPLIQLDKGRPNSLLIKVGRHYRGVLVNFM